MVSFEIEAAWPRHALVVGTVLVVVGGLMVSRLPTFSFKKGRVPRHLVLPALLVRRAGDGRAGEFAVDRPVAARPGLCLAHSLQLDGLSPPGDAATGRRAAGDVVTLHAVDSGAPPRE